MNRIKYISLMVLGMGLLTLAGCKKEEQKSNAELIVGTWNVNLEHSYQSYTEDNYEETLYLKDQLTSLTLRFSADGVLTYTSTACDELGSWRDEWSDPYRVEEDTLRWDVFNYHISRLDDKSMVMESVRTEDQTLANGTVLHTAEVKHYEMDRVGE